MWISKERYEKLVRNGQWNEEERKADDEWFRTHAAQLKSLAEGQAQLNVNCGDRLAALEKKLDGLARQATLSDILDRIAVLEKAIYAADDSDAFFLRSVMPRIYKHMRKYDPPPRAKPSKRRKAA